VLEGSPDPGGIPLRFLLKSVIIFGFLLLMLQALSQTIKSYFVARGWEEPERRVKDIV
jgi:TRAP-type mannitol/chloroaromatic compound transport system permease small subunit